MSCDEESSAASDNEDGDEEGGQLHQAVSRACTLWQANDRGDGRWILVRPKHTSATLLPHVRVVQHSPWASGNQFCPAIQLSTLRAFDV
ncbi:hypothetical protein H257_06686 [Aphanomyces astaci]|uniref:Uncharacterized protein n=1 Tax=Aphanomyces astaci TaxID=112090 RepID=W4GL21_APHAT|nr:hypothetical protein H257_06686 [Aphanomyces astaci]ETV80377.1 hypothetical protein H257_06686 [Aphanomyces astaci]|eukprot:XP_009830301.1 hypothetical protein H257_06686 [Aphanomyces astaci]